mmetsp:Transcript_25810/g.65482  ORF Transcript_25810/g.65482 Transcript_25810/m.65482 type:complete len:336 (-) Transcript_25810:1110-2117(-)
MHFERRVRGTLYVISENLLEVRYPSKRCLILATRWACAVCGLEMRTACVLIRISATHSPAARMVVPVSTRSTTASARPRPTAASTEPEMSVILVSTPSSLSIGSKYLRVSVGKEVAIRLPAKSGAARCLKRSGTCNERLHLPIPNINSVVTVQSASATMSCPVMPASTLPLPMKEAMSLAGRKTSVIGRLVHGATSNRSRRWYCSPAASTNLRHISASRPFLGSARSMCPAPSTCTEEICAGMPVECAIRAPSAEAKPSTRMRASSSSSRCVAAAACPCSPSILASSCASRTRSAAVLRLLRCSHVRMRRNVKTLSPPVERAVPPVGSVWFGPAP